MQLGSPRAQLGWPRRSAFLEIVAEYPAQVLETFYWYKVASVVRYLPFSAKIDVTLDSSDLRVRSACLIVLLVIFLWCAWQQTAFAFGKLTLASAIFLVWSVVPVLFAWGTFHTMVDVAFWCWAKLLCAALTVVEPVRRSTWLARLSK